MPKYRDVFIENDKTLADSGTESIELAVVDPITEIHIKVKNKNGASYNKNSPISRCISKIEVVDGANVIYSLDGMLAQAMSYYQRMILPSMQMQSGPSENQESHFVLRFGRHLWDKLYALAPNKFRNLQLKISYNFANVNSIGATGYLTANGKLTVITRLMEDLAEDPVGFMMAKNHYNWTTAASGDERISLPTDHPYVLMLFRAWEAETKLYSTIDNLKMSIDQDKDIPFDLDSWQFLKLMENEYGLFTLNQHIWGGNEENIQTWLAVGETCVLQSETDPQVPNTFFAHLNTRDTDSGHTNTISAGTDHTTEKEAVQQLMIQGQGLNHCFARHFGIMSEPDSWLQAPDKGDIKLIITQGNAGAAADLALLQAKNY